MEAYALRPNLYGGALSAICTPWYNRLTSHFHAAQPLLQLSSYASCTNLPPALTPHASDTCVLCVTCEATYWLQRRSLSQPITTVALGFPHLPPQAAGSFLVGLGFVAHFPWQAAGNLRAAALALVGLGFVAHLPPQA